MKFIRLFFLFVMLYSGLQAQIDLVHGSVEAQGILTGKSNVPFWMRSDQFGSVPLPGASGSFIATGRKDYDSLSNSFFNWGAGVQLRADLGSGSRLTLIEGYLKVRASIFELRAGRMKEIIGLVDTGLSSGAFSLSGNSLGIPQVEIAIPEYYAPPVLGGLIAFKGSFSHGWLGEQPVVPNNLVASATTYFHQVTLYGRLGKPNWKLHLLGNLNHEVFWGSEQQIFGKNWGLSVPKTFEYAVLGRTYHGSKVGNHLGSVDLGLEYEFQRVRLFVYRQSFYDEGALAKLANIADGLNGISLTNKDDEPVPDYYPVQGYSNRTFHWHKIVFELFYSKNQAGYPWSRRTASGDENYYNSNSYPLGWSYKGMGLGNPFITPAYTTREGFPNVNFNYFNNNRVVAFYTGLEGSVLDYRFTAKASYTMNYGTFGTSIWGYSTGNRFVPPQFGIWKPVNQFSTYLSVERGLEQGWTIGAVAAIDYGKLFYNSGGFILRLKKTL